MQSIVQVCIDPRAYFADLIQKVPVTRTHTRIHLASTYVHARIYAHLRPCTKTNTPAHTCSPLAPLAEDVAKALRAKSHTVEYSCAALARYFSHALSLPQRIVDTAYVIAFFKKIKND